MDSTGHRSTVAVAKNATSSPAVICPVAASHTPPRRQIANVTSGTSNSQNQMPAIAFAFSISVPRSSSAWRENRSSWCAPRPNALRTRMP
jgi:hypothetical protein